MLIANNLKISDSAVFDFRMNLNCESIRMQEPLVPGKALIHGVTNIEEHRRFLNLVLNH